MKHVSHSNTGMPPTNAETVAKCKVVDPETQPGGEVQSGERQWGGEVQSDECQWGGEVQSGRSRDTAGR